jgi:lysophospholipase L1-like esterase
VLIQKPRASPDEFEFPGVELLDAVIGEIPDERIFSRHDFFEIEANFPGADAPYPRMADEVHHFGGIKQRLCRHATTQDAQPADFFATFDDGSIQSGARGRPRRCVTAAATANHRHVKIKSAPLLHLASMSQKLDADKRAAETCRLCRAGFSRAKFICAPRDCLDNYFMRLNRAGLFLLIVLLVVVPLFEGFGGTAGHDFAQWEKEIAAFEALDRTHPPPRRGLLFVGSSTIRKWTTLAADFPNQPVLNRGFGGSEIVDSTHFADRIVFPYAPRMIFFRAGGNDLWAGKTPEAVFADFKEFVAKVQTRLPKTEIIFISWCPTPSRWKQHDKEKALNAMVADYAHRTPHLQYIETYDMVLGADGQPRPELFLPDQLHFNAAGYRLLTERVRPFLPRSPGNLRKDRQ